MNLLVKTILCMTFLLNLVGFSASSFAVVIYQFDGVITESRDYESSVDNFWDRELPGFQIGDKFFGRLYFDPAACESAATLFCPGTGLIFWNSSGTTLTASNDFTTLDGHTGATGVDWIYYSQYQVTSRTQAGLSIEFEKEGASKIANNTTMPLIDAIDASQFDLITIGYTSRGYWGDGEYDKHVLGEITHFSAVPLPASIWLMGSALVGLIGFKSKRHSSIQ